MAKKNDTPIAGYEITGEVMILRTKHTIRFKIGDRVEDVGELLDRVPNMAQVDEVMCSDSSDVTIVFHHEKRIKVEDNEFLPD